MRRAGIAVAVAILAAGCGQTPDMVTARLVDPRESRVWRQPLHLVEVRRAPLAPFPGMERMWRPTHPGRVDTIPGVRTFWPATMLGENVVIGFHGDDRGTLSVFQYDAQSGALTRSALPPWLSQAVANPPPAFAPGGRHVLFLARQPRSQMRVEVHSWPDGAPVVVGRSVRLNPKASQATSVQWGTATEFASLLPVVTDTGAVWLITQGRFADRAVRLDSTARLSEHEQPAVPAAPVSAFERLPAAFRSELNERGCTLPQSDSSNNVIQGHFAAANQDDWAVLCSRRGQSQILVYWGGPVQCPHALRLAPDDDYTVFYGSRAVFTRSIHPRDRYGLRYGNRAVREGAPPLAHESIEDAHHNTESTVWFCQAGTWRRHRQNR